MLEKALAVAAAGVAVAAGLVLTAAPAQAAGSYTTNCDGPLTVYGSPGDTVRITFGPGCSANYWYVWNVNGTYYNPASTYTSSGFLAFGEATPAPAPGWFSSYSSYPGQTPEDWYLYNTADGTPTQSFTATLLGTNGGGGLLTYGTTIANISFNMSPWQSYPIVYGGPGGGGTPIPDVIQQVGLPASGSCDAIDDRSLNWGGVTSGGWAKSWAEWANDGTGGGVCTRTLRYADGWTVVES